MEPGNKPKHLKGATTVSRHRAAQATRDFESFGVPELSTMPAGSSSQPPAHTPQSGVRCPGVVAYGLLGAGVWRSGSSGESGT